MSQSGIRALRVVGVLAIGIALGYIFGILPATIAALLVGPLDESRWWFAGALAAVPYLLVAGLLAVLWRGGQREHPFLFSFALAGLLGAAGSSVLFFVATLESQF
ncbi:MAG: hypothetical protein ACRDHO_14210 [Actinomycetota bacterium]